MVQGTSIRDPNNHQQEETLGPSWSAWEDEDDHDAYDGAVLGQGLRPLDRDARPQGDWSASTPSPTQGELWVQCPMCRAQVPRRAPLSALRTLASFAVMLVGVLAGTGLVKYIGALMPWLGYVVPAVVGIVSLTARLTKHLSLPEDCPHCGGPLRMAVLSEWEGADRPQSAYMQPRWLPQD